MDNTKFKQEVKNFATDLKGQKHVCGMGFSKGHCRLGRVGQKDQKQGIEALAPRVWQAYRNVILSSFFLAFPSVVLYFPFVKPLAAFSLLVPGVLLNKIAREGA